jgi:hypothetical protein
MKKTTAIAALALSLISSVAMAQERGGDAALGALSGAVVLGPIGAVVGAVVGCTAGPSIAHSCGLRRSSTPILVVLIGGVTPVQTDVQFDKLSDCISAEEQLRNNICRRL